MAKASEIRRLNERRVVECLLRHGVRGKGFGGGASQGELAAWTGMSQPTVSRVVEGLVRRGVLEEDRAERDRAAGRGRGGGRPSRRISLEGSRDRFLAIQVGVSRTRLMASPFRPPEGDEWKAEIETARTAAEVPAYVKELRSAVRSVRPRGCLATVVSLPGVVDEASAKVYLSANLRWLEKVSVRGVLKEAGVCGAAAGRVLYVQEIRALAVGHLLRVAGGQTDAGGGDFLLVDVGSGVGAAAVVGGRLYSGALPLSGEVGHTPVLGNGRRCGCGGLGCLETLVSRGGLLASARAEKRGMNWAEVVERLAEGPLPGWLRQSLSASAAAIASALNVMGLRHVVITGLLNELPESAREFLSNKIRAASMWARFGSIKIEYAPRQRAAGLVVLGVEAALAGM